MSRAAPWLAPLLAPLLARSLAPLLALLPLGCASSPRRVLGSPDAITRPPVAAASAEEAFGHQARVQGRTAMFYGELVACDPLYLYLHVNVVTENPWVIVPWAEVTRADVRVSTGNTTLFVTWTVLGTLTAVSHGIWASISAPVWLATGIPASIWGASRDWVSGRCPELDPYTRYPQGLPESVRPRFWGAVPVLSQPWGGPGGMPPGGPPAPPASP